MCSKCQSRELELIPELENMLGEYNDEFELFSETAPALTCSGLSTDKKKSAISANRKFAKEIGWGCLPSGKLNPIRELTIFLKLATPISEDELVCAVANWPAMRARSRVRASVRTRAESASRRVWWRRPWRLGHWPRSSQA